MSSRLEKIGFLNLIPLPILFERASRPELSGRPFVVVGAVGNRGLVVAASPEAFRAGVRAGITPDQARFFLPDLKIIEERPAVYFAAAEAVQDICERLIPMVDAERQDAFTLDLTGTDRLYPDSVRLIRTLQAEIENQIHLPSRAGLGPSRLVARLASMRAGEHEIWEVPAGAESEFLADYHVGVLPGVGVQIAKRLKWLGVHTVRQLAMVPPQTLEAAFGPKGIDLIRAARGHDPRPRRHSQAQKPLKRDVTLEQIFYDPVAIRVALQRLTAALGLELRNSAMQVRSIGLEIRYPDIPSHHRKKRIPPTDLDMILQPIAEDMFRSMAIRRVRLRGLALSYGRLVPRDDQLSLEFARDFTHERQRNLEAALDRIRNKYGLETIGPGQWWL